MKNVWILVKNVPCRGIGEVRSDAAGNSDKHSTNTAVAAKIEMVLRSIKDGKRESIYKLS